MPLIIVRDDITKMNVDAIVNAANSTLLGGGGVDGAIHEAAGEELLKECKKLKGCAIGNAKITNAYLLPCKKVIHTVGLVWQGGFYNEDAFLESCYMRSLELAKEKNLDSIAFPLISTGAYGYPKYRAIEIASKTIQTFLLANELVVYLVVYDKDSLAITQSLFTEINEFIDDNYVDNNVFAGYYRREADIGKCKSSLSYESFYEPIYGGVESDDGDFGFDDSLDAILSNIDATFSDKLLMMIKVKQQDEVSVYKRANIDRKLFSKIKSNKDYSPSKITILAFCFSLELTLEETEELLLSAGFALSHSNKFDLIIEYFITNEKYNIFDVNEALFSFNLPLLV